MTKFDFCLKKYNLIYYHLIVKDKYIIKLFNMLSNCVFYIALFTFIRAKKSVLKCFLDKIV